MNKRKQIERAAVQAARGYWTWCQQDGACADMMRHQAEGALIAYAQVLGHKVVASLCEQAGMGVPVCIEAGTTGFWMDTKEVA